MATLRIEAPGTWTLLADGGRPATRGLGVPVGGAADRRSLALGNALVGNAPDAPALEVALTGPTVVADAPLAAVMLGAPFDLEAAGLRLRAGKTFTLPAGVPLAIRGTPAGVRAYLCVAGGLGGPVVLGSVSSLGPVRAGDTFTVEAATTPPRFAALPLRVPAANAVVELRAVLGGHADRFDLAAFFGPPFVVGPKSNRMGLRLAGRPLAVPVGELTSEPVCPGTVQVPRDGQPIVLGMDCQTIGGYPRIAHVIRADLDLLGQLRPGMRVVFKCVSLDEAEALDRAARAEVDLWARRLRTGW